MNVRTENMFGQFVCPKSVRIKKGFIPTEKKVPSLSEMGYGKK
nr:hypothetical protein [Allomuricauda algicola]